MGKRCDFSSRSVVSPDACLALDELGVPRTIAEKLTFPETVTSLNYDWLKQLVSNGPEGRPGARYYISGSTGQRFDLKLMR